MPRKPDTEKTEQSLRPFMVIIDGTDRTIFAVDEADLQKQIAKIRESSPAVDGQ